MTETGLTAFLINMMKAPDSALATADVAKLAVKYDVSPEYAGWYIRQWLSRAR